MKKLYLRAQELEEKAKKAEEAAKLAKVREDQIAKENVGLQKRVQQEQERASRALEALRESVESGGGEVSDSKTVLLLKEEILALQETHQATM